MFVIAFPQIDPIAVQLGPLAIRWYALAYIAGIVLGWQYALKLCREMPKLVTPQQMDDFIVWLTLGIILGGRVGYVLFYNPMHFLQNPSEILQLWHGGMSFHGGMLGVMLAMYIFARRRQIGIGALLDFVAPLVPFGLAFGRLGNFIGQELWGRASDAPWAMVFPADPLQLARHPSQLYQFALEGVLLGVILIWFSARPRPVWAVSGLFSLGYGCMRFVAEFFREPDQHIGFQALGWLTRGQALCLPMIALGIFLLVFAYRNSGAARRK